MRTACRAFSSSRGTLSGITQLLGSEWPVGQASCSWPTWSHPGAVEAFASTQPFQQQSFSGCSSAQLLQASSSPRSAKCENSTPRWIQAWHTSTRGFHASWAASATSLEEVASDVHAAADQLTSLDSRLAELEGIEGMRTTVHSLAQLLDACQGQPDAITEQVMAELFTPTAVVAAEHHGAADGLDEVTELFKQVVQGLSFSRHYVSNLVAKVSKDDPSSGKAKFYLLVAASLAKGRDAWGMEVVEVKLRKGFDARWRIRNIQWQTGNILTPYDGKGWGSTPNILPPVNAVPK
ncbi:hypothetical protein V8C86DRAFT_2457642 [Haematococcus lacustris]